jgi:hypothetical protein
MFLYSLNRAIVKDNLYAECAPTQIGYVGLTSHPQARVVLDENSQSFDATK